MTVVRCPTCDRPVEWTEASRWRPFCSERCKLIDLGAWAAEKHAIPGEAVRPGDAGRPDEPDED
jgi:endogenous inhibitor of DNA gyrase (YacG/DUF329 family)